MDKKKILLVSLAHLSCDINGGALPAALPYVRAAHGLDYQAAGGLIFAYSCLSSLLQPLLGFLSDKHQKPWFIPLGVILAGFGLAIMGFMTHYWAIFAGIAISGVGSAFFHPEAARFANGASGRNKGTGMSFFSIGGNSGFIAGPLLVTVFVGAFGLHGMSVFAILASCTAFLLIAKIKALPIQKNSAIGLREAEFSAQDPQNAEAEELSAKNASGNSGKNNWPEFCRLMGAIIARAIIFTGCNTFIPLYWVSALGETKASGAIALVVFGIFGVGCNILGGFLTDRFGSVKIIRIAFLLMFPVLILFALADKTYLAWLILPFLGLVLYLPFSAQVVLGQKLLAKNIGFASGVTLGLATTLGGIAQPILGWLADVFGLSAIFFCLAALSLIASALSFTLSTKNG